MDPTTQSSFEPIKSQLHRPESMVITAGMPYANGPIHLGHLAGAFVPADIYARWWRMVIGDDRVLFVSGSDDHGVTSLIRSQDEDMETRDYIAQIRKSHLGSFKNYHISFDHFGSTSDPQYLSDHTRLCQSFVDKLSEHGLLSVRGTRQWFDESQQLFLPDRMVVGVCPVCSYEQASSQECDRCGAQYHCEELVDPQSILSSSRPILKSTRHLWLDMWPLADVIYEYHKQQGRQFYQKSVLSEILSDSAPILAFLKDPQNQSLYENLAAELPRHKKRYSSDHQVLLQFQSYEDLRSAQSIIRTAGLDTTLKQSWSQRSLSRDVKWGISLSEHCGLSDTERLAKTLYVWPESLIAPLSFTKQALSLRGSSQNIKDYWFTKQAQRHQFIGIDNVYFYGVMQTALWLAQQSDPTTLSTSESDLQFSHIHTFFHLQMDGQKMSKSRGNFFTADEILSEDVYCADHIRYFLAFLSLKQKPASFDLTLFQQRNDLLAGPINAAFEKPLSAARKHYSCQVPEGTLLPKVEAATQKVIKLAIKTMPKSQYPQYLLGVENYARLVNSLFSTYKPHDDRYPAQERRDALFSCFFILKNLVILLSPFAPTVMDQLRQSLALSRQECCYDELAIPMKPHHVIERTPRRYFSSTESVMAQLVSVMRKKNELMSR